MTYKLFMQIYAIYTQYASRMCIHLVLHLPLFAKLGGGVDTNLGQNYFENS